MRSAAADECKTGEGTSVPQTKEPTFLITGYEASRSSIETGDTVSITVYLSRTDGRSDSIRVVRGLDSFQGGTADVIKKGSYGSYEVTFDNLTYTGDTNKALNFTIYYDGATDEAGKPVVNGGYQSNNSVSPIRECVPYTEPKPEPVKEPEAQQALSVPEEPFRIIGEALHTYIIIEQGEAVLFIDKHAAHERIRFEALKKEDHPIMAQLLLAPVSAELSREEAAAVLENRALLERCGFETEDFGGGDVLIRQIPSDVDVEDAKALLQELAGDLLAGKTLDPDSLRDNLLHTIACKSAIKAGWQTSDEELRRLVQEVLSRDDIKYCPHGRPVCVTLTKRQLEKQFKRV